MLEKAADGAVFLLNSAYGPDEVWDQLPREVQEQIIDKNIKLYVIDAYKVAKDTGMGVRINTIMQTCFFAISGVLPRDEAIEKIKESIQAHLRPPRRSGRAAELRGRRSHPVAPVPGRVPEAGHQQDAACRPSCPPRRRSSSRT